jgi:hypothetical protein
MENSPASNQSDVPGPAPSGYANVPVEELPGFVPTHSGSDVKSPAAATEPKLPDKGSQKGTSEKPRFRYEFTYNVRGEPPSFVVLWDTNDRSACERVLGRIEFVIEYNVETGNGFIFVDEVRWCFQKRIAKTSYSFTIPRDALASPHKVDVVLEGLL